jgi:hypothetical protein
MNDAFTMIDNEYDLMKQQQKKEMDEKKQKVVGPVFKTSTLYDNNNGKNWILPKEVREE